MTAERLQTSAGNNVAVVPSIEEGTVVLRVDIDSLVGLRFGVPHLLDLFEHYGCKACFYSVMGWEGDIFSVLRHRIWRRIFRSPHYLYARDGESTQNARSITRSYGWGEILRMLFFPRKFSRDVNILKDIIERGHELSVHGYIHVKWNCMTQQELEREVDAMLQAYRHLFGKIPLGFAAPLALENDITHQILASRGIRYTSVLATESVYPYRGATRSGGMLYFPVFVRCAEHYIPPIEYFSRFHPVEDPAGETAKLIDDAIDKFGWASTFMHARNEGITYLSSLKQVLGSIRERGYKVRTFEELYNGIVRQEDSSSLTTGEMA